MAEKASEQYGEYIQHMVIEKSKYESLKELNSDIDQELEKIYKSI